MRLKIRDSYLICKIPNKCLNVRGWVEVVKWNKKMVPSLPLLACESSVSMKENPDRKKKESTDAFCIILLQNFFNHYLKKQVAIETKVNNRIYCWVKFSNSFDTLEILWKHIVFAEFQAFCPKLYGSFEFLKNSYTRKLDEILEFYYVLEWDDINLIKPCNGE